MFILKSDFGKMILESKKVYFIKHVRHIFHDLGMLGRAAQSDFVPGSALKAPKLCLLDNNVLTKKQA